MNSSMTAACTGATFAAMDRIDGRTNDQMRPLAFDLGIAPYAGGSVLVAMGKTRVICGVMIEEHVPRWMREQGSPAVGSLLNIRCSRIQRSRANRAMSQKVESTAAAWRFNA
jgi:ribonuclease PH